MKNVFLEGKNIYLRPIELSDAQGEYPTWLNSEEISRHNSHHTFAYTKEEASEYIQKSFTDGTKLFLAIVDLSTDKHIGNTALQSIDSISRSAEFSIIVGDVDFHGRGVGEDVMYLMLKHGFDALNLHRIYCGTPSNNSAMRKLALKIGMREEGLRKEAFFKNGEYDDIVEYGVLKGEFNDSKD